MGRCVAASAQVATAPAHAPESKRDSQRVSENIAQRGEESGLQWQCLRFCLAWRWPCCLSGAAHHDHSASNRHDVMFSHHENRMVMAPVAAGAAWPTRWAALGLLTLVPLRILVGTYYTALGLFVLLVLMPIIFLARIPVGRFCAAVASGGHRVCHPPQRPLAAGHGAHGVALPRWIVSFVIPTATAST